MTSEINPVLGIRDAREILEPAYDRKIGNLPGGGQLVAVIVNHGMGQQVPYETIEGVAKAIWRGISQKKSGATVSHSLIRRVRLGTEGNDEAETELVCAEIEIQQDEQKYIVHIYESYWAPLTEGKVTLKDVMAFLFDAGVNGFLNTKSTFGYKRWMFGSEQQFKLPKLRLMTILIALMLLLLALVMMNSVLVAAAASHAIGAGRQFPGQLTAPLTSDFIVADTAALLIALGTLGLWAYRKVRKVASTPRWLSWLGWFLMISGAVLFLLAAFAMLSQLASLHPEYVLWPSVSAWSARIALGQGAGIFLLWFIWAFEIGAAYVVRWFLVEYVGDVAAYIAAHMVSKFYELRQRIWKTAMKVSRAVYRAQADNKLDSDNPGFLYRKIIVVGHSLGSVIGYDVLNGLLLEDEFSKQPLDVVQRTRMFLTFGSPLDKTAFLFSTQKDMNSPVREVAAAAGQPMIQDYKYRPKEWVNLYSKSDVISGALDFYDPDVKHNAKENMQFESPVSAPDNKRVNNLPDPDASTPLAAHVEYWEGKLFADELVRGITT